LEKTKHAHINQWSQRMCGRALHSKTQVPDLGIAATACSSTEILRAESIPGLDESGYTSIISQTYSNSGLNEKTGYTIQP
jgi:hypothetical protein